MCVRGGAGAGAETRGGEGSKRLVADGLARSATGRMCAHTLFQLNFFFLSNFFFPFGSYSLFPPLTSKRAFCCCSNSI